MKSRLKKSKPLRRPKEESAFWRHFCNFWTVVLYTLIVADYFKNNALIDLIAPASIILTGSLVIYSAEKEFERWHDFNKGRHPGEWYVIGWTGLMIFLFVMQYIEARPYKVPAEVLATYIFVLGLLAITKKSKSLYMEGHKKARLEA